jgi:hypothetical protein
MAKAAQYRVPTEAKQEACNAFIFERYVKLLEKIGLLPREINGASQHAIREGDTLAWVEKCMILEKGRGGQPITLVIHHAVSKGIGGKESSYF